MHVHGDNLQQKETGDAKYADTEARRFLREIRSQYDVWKKANQELKGPFRAATSKDTETIRQRVALFATYKDFIDQQNMPRSLIPARIFTRPYRKSLFIICFVIWLAALSSGHS